jgi:hypothetical protein
MGLVSLDPNTKGLDNVAAGMILVDPSNGQGFVIIDIIPEGIIIDSGIQLEATQLAIVPQFQYYTARVEHAFFQESCEVSCYAHGDPQTVLWLHSIVLYSILRYRENLLEAQGFTQSSIANSPLIEDPYYDGSDGETAYVRSMQLTGQTEYSWIKAPRRIIENVALREKTESGYIGGIKILGNLDSPDFIDKSKEVWYTKKDE